MDINQTLENLRGIYQDANLDVSDCSIDPIKQFDKWMEEAVKVKCDEPNAFVLSTVVKNKPRARVVLLKGIQNNRFVFYTNYESAKGHEIVDNENVALTFLWLPLHRQVRVEGVARKVDAKVSDEYFQKRPRGSQLGAIASPQSKKINSRADLEKLFQDVEKKFTDLENLPRPSNWGGYEVEVNYFEFWQGRNNRMHDRVCYEKSSAGWKLSRLAP